MTKFTMFQLCRESDGYIIYYNYSDNKIYGCYNLDANVKPCYEILLIQPFILLAMKFINGWIMNWGRLERHLICMLAIVISSIAINYAGKKLIESTEDIRNRRMQELPALTEAEWESYLKLAEQQLKRQVCIYALLAAGIACSIALFVWSGSVIFLLLYMVLYFIAYPCIQAGCPIRKYKLIKSKRREI